MPLFEDPPRHDFPDRAIRRLLENPRNLRDLMAAVLPDLVDRFDFEQVERPPRTFLLDDWRRRESDMLFRLPFRLEEGLPSALVCLLVEHQSEPDPPMPLRVLVYAALFWEQEWKAWQADHEANQPLRLSPIIPIVFHTGPTPWRTNRTMVELLAGPEPLRAFAPDWQPLFWDLAERTPEELLQAAGEWLAALAVVRAERADEAAFRQVFAAVLRRLEGLSEAEKVRWHDLLWFVLSWGLRRRPGQEREPLLEAAEGSQFGVAHREEIRRMSETITQTWEQEMLVRGELKASRDNLRVLLEERFGPLPEAVAQRIEAMDDLERLRTLFRQAVRVTSLEELEL
jgi:hypothetical protein